MFLKQMEVQGFTLSSSPWEMTTIFQNFRISCGKPKAYANYLQLAFFTNISRNKNPSCSKISQEKKRRQLGLRHRCLANAPQG